MPQNSLGRGMRGFKLFYSAVRCLPFLFQFVSCESQLVTLFVELCVTMDRDIFNYTFGNKFLQKRRKRHYQTKKAKRAKIVKKRQQKAFMAFCLLIRALLMILVFNNKCSKCIKTHTYKCKNSLIYYL